jgi:hypothetical protein
VPNRDALSSISRSSPIAPSAFFRWQMHIRMLYQSLPLCVIDAVYSIGVRYRSVENVVDRYCKHFDLRKFRVASEIPPDEEQESVTSLCRKFEESGSLLREVFRNEQRTSARGGIPKAEAVYKVASALRSHGIEYLKHALRGTQNSALENDIRLIPGQTSGIALRYLWILAGCNEFVKPDRWILAFLQDTLGRDVTVAEAPDLVRGATTILHGRYPQLTPALLDHEIWSYQRKRES